MFVFERETQRSSILFHSPNGHNQQGWPRLEPGARSLVWVSHVAVCGPGTFEPSSASPGTFAGSCKKWNILEYSLRAYVGCLCCKRFNQLCQNTGRLLISVLPAARLMRLGGGSC